MLEEKNAVEEEVESIEGENVEFTIEDGDETGDDEFDENDKTSDKNLAQRFIYCNRPQMRKVNGVLYWYYYRDEKYGGCGHTLYRRLHVNGDKVRALIKCDTGHYKCKLILA